MVKQLLERTFCVFMAFGVCVFSGCSTGAAAIPTTPGYPSTESTALQPLATASTGANYIANTQTVAAAPMPTLAPMPTMAPMPEFTMAPMPDFTMPPMPTAAPAQGNGDAGSPSATPAPISGLTRRSMSVIADQQPATAVIRHKKHLSSNAKKKAGAKAKKAASRIDTIAKS